ncbi:acyl-CoA dehydrogenase family protein [Solimonas sp. SE-A11]|uniref:acyl-CoA dehydrogenase family protein n=1 Tax=Solimonas sp. SE-A11 TaxID=3054954 RepID=UPI00259C7A36|nr:acyl-CoA dehydrogenase family protein [Solimonas sp. SE-A11]MDM4771983.1 acyl-CoA dehydrogenase family protein [Solimonas sp. SE-A11]
MTHWLETLLTGPCKAPACPDVASWWPRHLARSRETPDTMTQAILGGYHADRVGWAFASAYQAALRALVPQLPADTVAALCVTEKDGNSPRAIRSELREGLLNGAKRWATLGPEGQLFLVVARDAEVLSDLPVLRVLCISADQAGVQVEAMPPTPFVPEVPHASLCFENVTVADSAVLPGDGYLHYVKPFRTVEDLHVQAAVLAYLVREALRLRWPRGWIERAAAQLLALEALATLPSLANTTHAALAGALTGVAALVADADRHWQASEADEAALRWKRDRALFTVAATLPQN